MHIVIIGGGASGIMAALTAAENKSNTVTLIERQARIGRKLLSTGNGRCNITNTNPLDGHYHGNRPTFVNYAIGAFDAYESMDYFSSLGLLTLEQHGGRVYPLSDSANSVVDVLRFSLESIGVNVVTSETVKSVGKKGNSFNIVTDQKVYNADRLIIACGGKAGGKVGGVSDGYDMLKSFGHKLTKLYPALVPVSTDNEYTRSLKGVRCDAKITLNGQTSCGELQFTENGVSGPAAFDISRTAAIEGGTLIIDLIPEIKDIYPILLKRRENLPYLECGSLLTGILHNRLAIVMVKYSGIRPSMTIGELSDSQLRKIASDCHRFCLKIKGVGNFESAQVTVGGISTDEFDQKTMQSRLVKGLYACGEVLDVDGDCGGYNLRWAWASGRLAGKIL